MSTGGQTRLWVRAAARLARALGPAMPEFFGSKLHRPFFMIGSGRSGTTLLANLLARHPSIAVYPSEANELWHADLYPWHRANVNIAPMWVDPYTFTTHSLNRLQWSRVCGIFGAFQFMLRKPLFLNKSVMLTFMLKEIGWHFSDARFIHLYRDGRAVALSYAKKHLDKINRNSSAYALMGITSDFESLVNQSFKHWMEHIEAVERADAQEGFSVAGRLMELSYEELSLAPAECLERILQFMGLGNEGYRLAETAEVDNRNSKVFEELPGRLLRRLTESGASVLERKGYAIQ